jgi:hypothetical protein
MSTISVKTENHPLRAAIVPERHLDRAFASEYGSAWHDQQRNRTEGLPRWP